MLGTFLGSLAQQMDLANALVARVPETERVRGQSRAASLEQRQIVVSSRAESRCHYFATGQVCQDLRFHRVSFLFAAVVVTLPLLFWGRSMGDSLASTTTTSKTAFVLVRDFLPGSVNLPDWIRASSTRLMVRQAVGSVTRA